ARRMIRRVNCSDELMRTNSPTVSRRKSMGLEPSLVTKGFLALINDVAPKRGSRQKAASTVSRRSDALGLRKRENLSPFEGLRNLSLLALFAPNSREGLPQIGVRAADIMERRIEDRFHRVSRISVVAYGHHATSVTSKRRS